MNKGVFSMYATKPRKFFLHEYSFPNHKETELSAYISDSVTQDLYRGLSYCMEDITRCVVKNFFVEISKKGRKG